MKYIFIPIILIQIYLSGCSNEQPSSLDEPKQFFSAHKSGTSPDYGIIKWNNPKDHVISVHGFSDDLKSCIEVADALNFNACKEIDGQNCLDPYSCIPLNH